MAAVEKWQADDELREGATRTLERAGAGSPDLDAAADVRGVAEHVLRFSQPLYRSAFAMYVRDPETFAAELTADERRVWADCPGLSACRPRHLGRRAPLPARPNDRVDEQRRHRPDAGDRPSRHHDRQRKALHHVRGVDVHLRPRANRGERRHVHRGRGRGRGHDHEPQGARLDPSVDRGVGRPTRLHDRGCQDHRRRQGPARSIHVGHGHGHEPAEGPRDRTARHGLGDQ
jgi:hypothetical protein